MCSRNSKRFKNSRKSLKAEGVLKFKILFNEMYPALFHYARLWTGSEFKASQIVEDVFIGFWNKRLGEFPVESFKSDLYSQVTNLCLQFSMKNFLPEKDPGSDELSQDNWELHANFWICQAEVLRNIHRSLLNLPRSCRKPRYLAFIERLQVEGYRLKVKG